MDTSINRKEFILGRKKIKSADLQPEDVFEIINYVLEKVKPYLKYLSGFEMLDKRLNCWLQGNDRRETADEVMKFSEGMSKTTRCLEIIQLSFDTSSKLTNSYSEEDGRLIECDRDFGVSSFRERSLMLSQKGELLELECKFERKAISELDKELSYKIKEIATMCRFSLLADSDLLNIVKERFILWRFINTLSNLINQTIKEKRTRLNSIECLGYKVSGILERISE